MKLKQRHEDFQVEELSSLQTSPKGPYALYRLEKRGWTTLDAIQVIRRRWQLEAGRLSYGGMKDRHALTGQYLTIWHGPRRGLEQQGIVLTYLGQAREPHRAEHILANRFQIVLRDLREVEESTARRNAQSIADLGVPNYFDDQRFGSVAADGTSVARSLVRGEYEDALKLALRAPYEHDRAEQKAEKAILDRHWGDWPKCKSELPKGHARSLVDYLVSHPTDFKGAMQRLRPDLGSLYLAAYQSYLWNRLLAAWLRKNIPATQLEDVALRLGPVPMHLDMASSLKAGLPRLRLPLPSARIRLSDDHPLLGLLSDVLAEQGLTLDGLKLRGFRRPFFSKGDRPALCLPASFTHSFESDEFHPGRQALSLRFELPRGSYATLIVKRLFLAEQTMPRLDKLRAETRF